VSVVRSLSDSFVQQTLLGQLWDQAPALVFVADNGMRYVAANTTACETLGYTREELLSLRVDDIAVADDAGELYDEMLESGEHAGRTVIRAKDGTLYMMRYQASACEIGGLAYYVSVGFVERPAA
jgi:PAS domain S-box-containing protein